MSRKSKRLEMPNREKNCKENENQEIATESEREKKSKRKWWRKNIVKIDLMATSSLGSRHRLAPLIHWLLCR